MRGRSDCDRELRLASPVMTRDEMIRDAIGCFDGWTYTPMRPDGKRREVPHYPWDIPGVKNEIIAPEGTTSYTDCCAFVEAVIISAYEIEEWGSVRHGKSMLLSRSQPFSPVDVLADAGLVATSPQPATGPAWYAMQGWRTDAIEKVALPTTKGHTMLIVVEEGAENGAVTVHEANVGKGVHAYPTTWVKLRERYPVQKVVRLRT